MEKLITVITVVYNAKVLLETTVRSVLACKTEQVEYVVIDGGSTDGSAEIMNAYGNQIDYFVSEPDKGIYDAMNKGWKAAKGRYLLYINAGDLLDRLPLEELAAAGADLLAFPVQIAGRHVFYPHIDAGTRRHNTVHHQGSFYRRETQQTFQVEWRVFADYDLLLRMMKKSRSMLCFSGPVVATHTPDGVSNQRSAAKEFFRLIRHHFGWGGQLAAFAAAKFRGSMARLRK